MIDAHIHLDQYEDALLPSLLQNLPEQQIEALIAVSMNLTSSMRTRDIAARYPGRVKPAYGFHPEQPLPSEEELTALLDWIEQHAGEMTAVGEIGLPYYSRAEALERGEAWDMAPYIALLDKLLALAARLDKPVVLHAVYEDAWTVCDLLDKHGITRAHFHWFKGPAATVDRMIRRGYSISFTPDILYEQEIQELARRYPPELVMAETDGPWPFEGPFAGRVTHPAMVHEAAAAWGALHGYAIDRAKAVLTANTVRFYQLKL
ncbi:TatD family hydrolase [Paenibacillus sp. MMS20-IR301]|uniref:TatD family hydrolase n=1 Tax=Paenibacillus sp. MMS20-IR301 TaxID=2895946 RepID=UPI0028E8EE11|nr:TatD family hydrolase [Paenibacillus sp. MMS20-IR301]WNS41125.1 TatD family hydrolase [Paenibacillus sp. MMS20-IR301]